MSQMYQLMSEIRRRTSENSVMAKFTGIAHLPHRPGPEGLPQEGA
jgi:hypothetical protein